MSEGVSEWMRKAFCEVIPHAAHTGYRHSTRLDAVAYYTVACMAKMKYYISYNLLVHQGGSVAE